MRGPQLGAGRCEIGFLREVRDLLRPVVTSLLVDTPVRLGVKVSEEVEVIHPVKVLAEHLMGAPRRRAHHLRSQQW